MKRLLCLSLFVAILGFAALVEAATTEVNRKHPLLAPGAGDAAASVYFIRPAAGFRGVMGRAVSIHVAGKELLKLAKGEYTLVRIKPWEGNVVVKSSTVKVVAGRNNMMKVEESRRFSFVGGKEYYILAAEANRPAGEGSSFPPVPITRERALEVAVGLTPVGDAVESPLAQ